ncbi:YhgE/Pip family protein [Mammaliicoccus stepanovicii]|uniref:Phage infection protein n=1 Tax=Mammaliicoccus stepanovicii TaxID=643214 RepID=A0A239YLS3_9STAP|nr:YhgE/Pip family protein [Mammaliicoccus stepanovicii]PNZ76861.1 DUF3533 domain-containing protein [Mammaliicoccus stepanovicii]GGI41101.1 hypothetical protein GCM10010896_11680 [Mammaliicoccus stepanovicii]SNV59672.1 phage infection protein [Mammaliicoccus stepanovicii]
MFDDIKNLWTHKFLLVSLIAIMLLPLIYSSVFVGSLWDPYGKTQDLKISVVNEDNGGKVNGKQTNIGDEVVDKLKDNDKFKWEFVKQSTADKHLEHGDSFAVITIPSNTSKNAGSMLDKTPKKIDLKIKTNPGYSYTGAQIATKAVTAVENDLSTSVREQYISEIFKGMNKLTNGYKDTSKALGQMSDAENQLIEGSKQVDGGLEQLAPMAGQQGQQLLQGSMKVTQGITDLQSNNNKLKENIDKAVKQSEGQYFNDKNVKAINTPIVSSDNDLTEVNNYGQSFAPYILALSLFVGPVAFSAVYPIDKRIGDATGFRWWLSKFVIFLTQAIGSAIALAILCLYGFEIDIANPGYFTLTLLIWSITAYMIVTFLTVVLGNIGKFLSIILLILQLGSSEGTFPIQLSGGIFQTLHPFSPMSYVIKAIRENIFNFESDVTYLHSLIILSVLAVVFAALTLIVYIVRSKYPHLRRKANENDY